VKHPLPALAHLRDALADLERDGLLRVRPTPHTGLSFCSNDYLGLAAAPIAPHPGGAGASRLVAGEHDAHRALERDLARWLETPSALAFSSGYAANLGVVSALAQRGDWIISDELNHASLIDGARLSRAAVTIVPHLDVDAVHRALRGRRAARAWVVTESYFSMDADSPDLAALRAVCDTHGAALVVDEAHALGALGPDGRGLCAEAGVVPDVLLGTFGKSFGRAGAFVAGGEELTAWVWNRARSFVFSTGLSPAIAEGARWAVLHAASHPELRARLHENAAALRRHLAARGVAVAGFGHIIPVLIGGADPAANARAAVEAAATLRGAGIHVQPIRPPTVPPGRSRLRVTATAAHTPDDVERAADAIAAAVRP